MSTISPANLARALHAARVAGPIDDVFALAGGAAKSASDGLSGAAKSASEGFAGAAKSAGEGISEAAHGVSDTAKKVGESISSAAHDVAEGVSGAAHGVSDSIKSAGGFLKKEEEELKSNAKWAIGLGLGIPVVLAVAGLVTFAIVGSKAAAVATKVNPDDLKILLPLLGPEGAAMVAMMQARSSASARQG